ncbi:putative endoglucanase, partial [Aureobasidium melanogenum]
MSFKIAAAAALATLASTVSAHGHLQSIGASGTVYAGFNNSILYSNTKPELIAWSDTVKDNGYVSDYTSPDMICHAGAGNAKLSAPVNGGDTVTFNWDTWPTSHKGPLITYLANCNGDCATVDKTALKWFKIDAVGIISGTSNSGTWASDKLISDGYKWDVKIPDSIASGNYAVRHEIIALHSANNVGGAQNYPQCINLEVKSSGSDNPEGVVGTELYTAQDKGIYVNIYYPGFTADEYDMPGPALYTGGSGSGSAPASSASASSTAQASSTSAAPASSSAQATYAASSAQTYAASSAQTYAASSAEATYSASSSGAAPITTQAAVVSSAASSGDDYIVTAYETDVVTQSTAVTVTAGASATAAAAVSDIASAIPPQMLTSTISAGIPTGTAAAGVAKPTKALPEGTTLEDLLSWVEYLFAENSAKAATKHRRHARAFHY